MLLNVCELASIALTETGKRGTLKSLTFPSVQKQRVEQNSILTRKKGQFYTTQQNLLHQAENGNRSLWFALAVSHGTPVPRCHYLVLRALPTSPTQSPPLSVL